MPNLVTHPAEVKVISRRFGQGAAAIDKYLELDGYKAVQQGHRARARSGSSTEMKASNLRGRGGAGFPTGMKWSFVPKQSDKPKYIVVNGDESEPGTCKDHADLRERSALADRRHDDRRARHRREDGLHLHPRRVSLPDRDHGERAIAEAYATGFLGKNIFGTGIRFRRRHAHRRGRLRGRRGVGAAGIARRQARHSAHRLRSRPCRAVRRPDRDQQRRDDCHACRTSCAIGGAEFAELGTPKQWRHTAVLPHRPRRTSPASTNCRWAST